MCMELLQILYLSIESLSIYQFRYPKNVLELAYHRNQGVSVLATSMSDTPSKCVHLENPSTTACLDVPCSTYLFCSLCCSFKLFLLSFSILAGHVIWFQSLKNSSDPLLLRKGVCMCVCARVCTTLPAIQPQKEKLT